MRRPLALWKAKKNPARRPMDVEALTIGARTGFPVWVKNRRDDQVGSCCTAVEHDARTPIEAKRGGGARECSNRQVVERAEVGDRGGDVWVRVADRVPRLRARKRRRRSELSESPRTGCRRCERAPWCKYRCRTSRSRGAGRGAAPASSCVTATAAGLSINRRSFDGQHHRSSKPAARAPSHARPPCIRIR